MRINQFKLNPIEKNGQYVLTTAQLAQAYGVDIKVISKNFTRNKKRFKEGVHYYHLTEDEFGKFFRKRD